MVKKFKDFSDFVNENKYEIIKEDMNPYVGIYKINIDIDEFKNILDINRVEYASKNNNIVIETFDFNKPYELILHYEGVKIYDFKETGVVILKSKPFTVPDGAFM